MKCYNKKQKLKSGNKLLVDDIFHSIQTEGPFAGRPAYFIRLYGCNLNCSFCDQPQREKPTKMLVEEIVERVSKYNTSYLVVITGGEPFLQNFALLAKQLIKAGFTVQVETNGTLDVPHLPWEDVKKFFVVVSPKTKKVTPKMVSHALAFKYVVSSDVSTKTGLPKGVFMPANKAKIILSPMSDGEVINKHNIQLAVGISLKFGYPVTIQWHKIINMK